uniref:hypothetical protein n=1 Tax=Leptospirillum ferriphilum TaxID=178606 RepID=UPI000A66672F
MTLSWEMILREIDRYFNLLNIRSKCTWTLVEDFQKKCAEQDAERDRHMTFVNSSVGGCTAKAVTTRGEALPGDNFDLGMNAAVGALMSGALMAPGTIINGVLAFIKHKEQVSPRPFLSSPGSHKEFETLLRGNPLTSTDLNILSD